MWTNKNTLVNGAEVRSSSDAGQDWFVPGMMDAMFGPADMAEVMRGDNKVSVTFTGDVMHVDIIDRRNDLRVFGFDVQAAKVTNIQIGE